jgi:hypothetical protein
VTLAPGPVLGSFLNRRDAAAARPLLPPIQCTRPVVKEETPRGGWVALIPCHTGPLLLNRSRAQLVEEKPSMPLAVRRAGQVALAVVLGSASDARWEGAEASIAFPRDRIQSRVHAPDLGVRAGWAARLRPASRELVRRDRRRWAGSVDQRRVKAEREKGREVRETGTSKRVPPGSASG